VRVKRWLLAFLFVGVASEVGCGDGAGPDTFGPGVRAGQGGEAGAEGEGGESQGGAEPVLGGPCLDDGQCNDELDCTLDRCDPHFDRCRHDPVDAACDDGTYCNGKETCDTALGCRVGPVVSCNDLNPCTIDACVELTQSCRYEPRDADGDGDPATSCLGTDCDDFDPLVSGASAERCGNADDDDCDGQIDEADCLVPAHDRCGDALSIEGPGSYELTTAGAGRDFSLSCAADEAFRDVVIAVIVPDDGPRDIDVVAVTAKGNVALAATDQCGSSAAETDCAVGVANPQGDSTARLVLRGREPGAHALLVAADRETDVVVRVRLLDPVPELENRTCGTTEALPPGVPARVVLAGLPEVPATACDATTGAVYYALTLDDARDVRVRAAALDDYGLPIVSLRTDACLTHDDEISCRSTSPSELFARSLPAGSYVVALAGTGPAEVELVVSLSDPTAAPATEGCTAPPELAAGETELVELADHTDAVQIGCLVGAPDATFELATPEPSDVLLVQIGSEGDTGGVLVAEAPCSSGEQALACQKGEDWPVRVVAHGVAAGSVRAVVETASGAPASLTAFRRPASNSVAVLRADECGDAVIIPEQGGRFEGNTSNLYADYSATCDYGGAGPTGATDQMLRLELSEPRRVVLDLQGSAYDTLLVVRHDDGCPGSEVSRGCSLGVTDSRSFLDLTLEAGAYNVQIDGYNGASGKWVLEVFTADP